MRIGVLGTGMVGQAIGSRLVALGHEVQMGSREAGNENARAWVERAGHGASEGSFEDAAAFGEMAFNCNAGAHSLAALEQAGRDNLAGKVLVDVANVLDSSEGAPPTVGVGTNDSLGEQIQRAFPDTKVVKSLNTMNCEVMVDPSRVPGDHSVFVCGDDVDAKDQVKALLESFGWPSGRILDLGGIRSARGAELYVALWLALWGAVGTGDFNIAVVRSS
jgi:8-hydroxy-5-deazaflavin:NADPH oxidoreductase